MLAINLVIEEGCSYFIYIFMALAVWFGFPYSSKKIQVAILRRRCKKKRLIALTYDDGPGRHFTSNLLEILNQQGAKASFFVVGSKVNSVQDIVDEIIVAGHEVGSHSYCHLHAWKNNPVSVFIDIHKGLRTVRTVTECRLFRAPYGKITLGSMIQIWLQDCKQAWWTIDSTDTRDKPRKIDEIVAQVRHEGGGIILMHDMDRFEKPELQEFVIELTKRLIALAKTENFRICKLGEVIL